MILFPRNILLGVVVVSSYFTGLKGETASESEMFVLIVSRTALG